MCASAYAEGVSKPKVSGDVDYRMLHGERVSVVTGITNGGTWLQVRFQGDESEIKYDEVKVQGFDKDGKEFPVGQMATKDVSYMRLPDVGNAPSGSYAGFYTALRGSVSVSKVKVSWKGEETEFRVPPLLKAADYKMLRNEQVQVELSHNAERKPLLQVVFYGSEPEIKYSEVTVKAFDKLGNETPLAMFDAFNNDTYTNFRLGQYRGDSNWGAYKPSVMEDDISKVTVAWKGEKVEFSPPSKRRGAYLTSKPLHGGQVSVMLTGWPGDGPKIFQVMLKGIREAEVRYDQITLSVVDNRGIKTRSTRFTGDRDTYTLTGRDSLFMGMYKAQNAAADIAKVTMKWGDEEVEFAAADLVPH